jgi:hypothetical protein
MTEKEKSKLANHYQSTDPMDWKTGMTWCEAARQDGHSPEDEWEIRRDTLQQSAPHLSRPELRQQLDKWIAFAVEAVIDHGQHSKQRAESLSKDELEEELHRWVCLTADAVRGLPSFDIALDAHHAEKGFSS